MYFSCVNKFTSFILGHFLEKAWISSGRILEMYLEMCVILGRMDLGCPV